MKELKMICLALLMMHFMSASATETVVWKGSKTFSGWGDQLSIDGSKLSKAKADDVLCLSITAQNGAQLQLSWGSGWTCFEALEHADISGNFELQLTALDASRVRQGIHIKGVSFTLTAVTLRTIDGEYETLAGDLFAWQHLLLSGATQGQKCTVGLKAYGGAGWYWPETVDLSGYGSIVVELLQPAAEPMMLQLLYGDTGVKRQNIAKGATSCRLVLSATHKRASSLNIISEKAQMVAIGSVNLADKQGNIIAAVGSQLDDTPNALSVEYYDLAGRRLSHPQPGINIVKRNLEGNRTIVRKERR